MSSLSQLILTTVCVLFLVCGSAESAVFQWTGLGLDDLWSNGDNWDQGGAIPGVLDEVVLSEDLPSVMGGDFTIGSFRLSSSFNSTMDFGNHILTIADSIDLRTNSALLITESLNLQLTSSALLMRFQDSLQLSSLSILGDLSLYGNHGTLLISNEFYNDGVVELNNLQSHMEGPLWTNNGALNSTGTSYPLKVGSDTIVSWGLVNSDVTFFKRGRSLPTGNYSGDLVLSTEGLSESVEYVLDTANYVISGDLRVEIHPDAQYPIRLSSDTALVIIQGDFITSNLGDTSLNAVELALGDADLDLHANVYLHDLSVSNPKISGPNGIISHHGLGTTLEIENSDKGANQLNTLIMNQSANFESGTWVFADKGHFQVEPNASVEIDWDVELTIMDSSSVQLNGDLRGLGELHIQTEGTFHLGDTVNVGMKFSLYTIEIPALVYNQLVFIEFNSPIRQIFMRFGAGSMQLLGGLSIINDSVSTVRHVLDWATLDPDVLIRKNFVIHNNSSSTEPIYLWGDGTFTLDVLALDWSQVRESGSSSDTIQWIGEGTSYILPSQDTMATFYKSGSDTTIIFGRDFLTRSWVQNNGRLDLNGLNLSASDHIGIDGDSTSLAPLDGSQLISEGEVVLSGDINSPIQIRSTSSLTSHSIQAGTFIDATHASIENSQVLAPLVGSANNSFNLGGNSRWNFGVPTGLTLSNDTVNDGAVDPWFVGVLEVIDGADSLGNDTYIYGFSTLVDSVDNAVFRLSNDSLFFSQTPDIGLGDTYPVGLSVRDQVGSQYEDTLYVFLRDSNAFVISSVDSLASVLVFDLSSWQFKRLVSLVEDTLLVHHGDYAQIQYEVDADSSVIEVDFHAQQLGLDSLSVLQEVGGGQVFRAKQFFLVSDSIEVQSPQLERVWYHRGESEFYKDTLLRTETLVGLREIWLDFKVTSRALDLEELSINISQGLGVEALLISGQLRLKLLGLEGVEGVVDLNLSFYPGAPQLTARLSLGRGEIPPQSWIGPRHLESGFEYRAVDGSQTGSSPSWGVWYAP